MEYWISGVFWIAQEDNKVISGSLNLLITWGYKTSLSFVKLIKTLVTPKTMAPEEVFKYSSNIFIISNICCWSFGVNLDNKCNTVTWPHSLSWLKIFNKWFTILLLSTIPPSFFKISPKTNNTFITTKGSLSPIISYNKSISLSVINFGFKWKTFNKAVTAVFLT